MCIWGFRGVHRTLELCVWGFRVVCMGLQSLCVWGFIVCVYGALELVCMALKSLWDFRLCVGVYSLYGTLVCRYRALKFFVRGFKGV